MTDPFDNIDTIEPNHGKDIAEFNRLAKKYNKLLSASTEDLPGEEDRIPCIAIVNGLVVKVNCKTGEVIK